MGRSLALVLIAILAACLALALAFQALMMALWVPCVVLVVAGGVLVASCVNLIGAVVWRSYARDIREGGKELSFDPSLIARKSHLGLTLLVVGAALLAVGLFLGGSPLLRFTAALLSL